MTPTDPQADRLRDALTQRADTLTHDGAPSISLEAVQGRAGRIRRNRRIAAGAGVAAALAVAAPLGLAASGQLAADDGRLAPAAPVQRTYEPVGEVDLTTVGLPQGARTDVPWIDVRRDAVVAGDLVVDAVEMPQDAVRWAGGLLVTGDAGDSRLFVLDELGRPLGDPVELPAAVDALVGAPSLGEVGWVQEVGAEQAAVIAPDDEVLASDEHVVVQLPSLGGFTPVGIGPAGLVLNATYPDGRSEVLLAGRDGTVTTVAGVDEAVGVDPQTGVVAGNLSGDRACAMVVGAEGEQLRAPDCDLVLRSMSPDGRWVTATGSDSDGIGDRSMTVLDTATGEVQVAWLSRSNPPTDLTHVGWEDADTVLAAAAQSGEASVLRLELDGSVERATPVVPMDPFGDLAVVLPRP